MISFSLPSREAPWCCRMDCDSPASYGIYGGSGHFEDDTQACEDHVGYLLGTPDWLEKDNTEWTVASLVAHR